MQFYFLAIALGIGLVAELAAYVLGLRTYRVRWIALLNIVVGYGFVMGGLAAAWKSLGNGPIFLIAFFIGLTYEIANATALHWWEFNQASQSGSRRPAVILILALLCGIVPLVTVELHAAARRWATASNASPLEQLKEREVGLVNKLDQLRTQTRNVESKLDALRQRKGRLLERQGQSLDAAPPAEQ